MLLRSSSLQSVPLCGQAQMIFVHVFSLKSYTGLYVLSELVHNFQSKVSKT